MSLVRKGWLKSAWRKRPIRIIQDEWGNVFYPGCGAWRQPLDFEQVRLLPGTYDWLGWPHQGWWESNWKLPEWAWLYGA